MMNTVRASLIDWSADTVLFWVLQILVVGAVVVAFIVNQWFEMKAGRGGAVLSVKRGDQSMAMFYGSYVALNGLLVALCLTVDVIQHHRVFCGKVGSGLRYLDPTDSMVSFALEYGEKSTVGTRAKNEDPAPNHPRRPSTAAVG